MYFCRKKNSGWGKVAIRWLACVSKLYHLVLAPVWLALIQNIC